ncbi:hypothetical protein MBLNU13_g01968t1 [Cladosporium sp. NU13]
MQKLTLRILHINQIIRNESQDICTKLAKRHIEALEAGIEAEHITPGYRESPIAAPSQQPNSSPAPRVDFGGAAQDGAEKAVISPLGFLGESSASAVVAELIDSMGETPTEAIYAQAEDRITESMVDKGAAVLYHLQGIEARLEEFEAWMRIGDGYLLFRQAYQVFISELWHYFRTELQAVPQERRLQYLSRVVWQNTHRPMTANSNTTIEGWANQATGRNLRWETVEAWARFSDVCNVAVELGLHKEKHTDARTPFFLCELRIRLFEAIYVHDKYVSTYLGRPPRISYRHCVIQSPIDLCDDDVCSSPTELAKILANLNNGFVSSGKLGRATVRRAATGHFIIREEILEIVLGNPQDDVTDRIHQIREKIARHTEEMPPFIRLDPEELLDHVRSGQCFEIPGRKVTWRPLDVVLVLGLHCNMRHTDFLLERALVRRSKCDPSKLIASARSLLNLVMKATSNSGFLHGFHLYKVELLAFFAIPTAAVLAIELLKHDQLGIDDEALPRSTIIQQLSVLVAALEDVRPDDGNRSMCELGMNSLRKVLDRLLSQKRLMVPPAASYPSENIETVFPATNDMEFLSWLGDVDFDGNLWLDGH